MAAVISMVSGGPGATKYFTASSFDDRLFCGHGDERSNLKGASKVIQASAVEDLPRNCTFSPSDWKVLSEFWFPIGLKGDFTEKPLRVRLLDEDLAAEVHVRADKASIAMRRWMIDIGLGGEFTA